MRVLIVNENKKEGGAELYVSHLKKILMDIGDEVGCLYFSNVETSDIDKKEWVSSTRFGKVSKLLFDPIQYFHIRKILSDFHPDYIILNNFFSSPITELCALHSYPVVQIVHDYTPVCPKSTCITDKGDVCKGYKFCHCKNFCTYHDSKIQISMKLFLLKILEPFRRKIIKKYISPSERLAEYLMTFNYDADAIPNPIMKFSEYQRKDISSVHHKYVYLGRLEWEKGIFELLPAFQKFSENRDVSLHMYGKIRDEKVKSFCAKFHSDKIQYHGLVPNSQIPNILRDGYALVVPSRWMENYPTTVLEGMMNGILVIGSDRGGIPEQLADERGIVYPWGESGLYDALCISDKISKEKYHSITDRAHQYVLSNNTSEVYRERFLKIIKAIKS